MECQSKNQCSLPLSASQLKVMKQLTAISSYSVLFQTLNHPEDSSRFLRPVIQDDGSEADHSVMESPSSRSCHSWLFPSSCRIVTETVIKQMGV